MCIGIKMIHGKWKKWNCHQPFVFGVIGAPKLVYETRVWIPRLITRKEGISTLQRPFKERLPICSLSFDDIIPTSYIYIYFLEKLN